MKPVRFQGPAETGTVDSGAAADTFPEGVYLAESPSGEVVTMTYGDGIWRRILEDGRVDCVSTYTVETVGSG